MTAMTYVVFFVFLLAHVRICLFLNIVSINMFLSLNVLCCPVKPFGGNYFCDDGSVHSFMFKRVRCEAF